MISLALKMLIGNRASFFGVIFGIFLATLLISQQSAIFLGLVSRSYRTLTDIPSPTIWIMDPATESDDRVRGMPEGNLEAVRSVPEVEWAVPINVIHIPLVTRNGIFQISQLYGIDDASLIGAPKEMIEGHVRDLRREGGIIVDVYSANGALAVPLPDGTKRALKIGDELEINQRYAVVVGICKITQGFYPQPIIFTSTHNFHQFTSFTTTDLAFIAAKSSPEANLQEVCNRINAYPGMKALTLEQFKWRIIKTFLETGILINFGLSVGLGFIVGFSIAGQIFYIMTLENVMYYALIKAIGGTEKMILQMILFQALVVGLIGFILGIGATMLWGMAIQHTTLAFLFPWQLLVFTGLVVLVICILTAGLSISKVFRAEPKSLMGT
ncbi:MAG: ABC transporter permease [Parachlamydiaceae bacterium]